jgi:hypothetical protein
VRYNRVRAVRLLDLTAGAEDEGTYILLVWAGGARAPKPGGCGGGGYWGTSGLVMSDVVFGVAWQPSPGCCS